MPTTCSLQNAPVGVSVASAPVNGECVVTVSDAVPEGTQTFTVVHTDTGTGQVVAQCPATLNIVDVTGEPGLSKAEVEACIEAALTGLEPGLSQAEVQAAINQAIADAGIISASGTALPCCDSQIIRINYCGESFMLGDWDGDHIIDADFSPDTVTYTGVAPNPGDAVVTQGFLADGNPDGRIPTGRYAVRAEDGFITHVAVCGEWVRVGGTEIIEPPDFETVCITTPATPALLDSTAAGLTVNGAFYPFNISCPDKQITECPSRAVVYGGPANPNGTPLPDLAFETVTSSTAFTGTQGCTHLINGDNFTQDRETHRFEFGLWQPYGGACRTEDAINIELQFEIVARSDNIGVGLLSPAVPQWANVVSVTPPPGAVNNFHYANYGDHVAIITGVSPPAFPVQGQWKINFAVQGTLPPNQTLDATFFSIGNSGPENENVQNIRMTVTAPPVQPCYPADTPNSLAFLANSVDPNDDVVWVADGDQICAVVPTALVSQYTNGQAALTI